ncbi:MAG: helicase-related protein [Nitrososphaerota archaeon]
MIIVGSRVKIKTKNETGTVIELRGEFARVLTATADSWYPMEQLEEDLSLIDKMISGKIDDGLDFILSIDAYRLLTEYKFNPYVLASSTKIQIFPHQIDEVTRILEKPRMMIADEVGLGKTITAALVACELQARGLANKLLFIVPKALIYKWRDELNNRFEMGAEILDSMYVKVHGDPFKRREFCYVSSMDYLKQEHVLKILEDAEFDMIVVDEAHKFALGTDRLQLGEQVAPKTNHMLFLTATPHNGNNEDYIIRMKLLDPYITDVQSASHILIRNLKEDVIDLDGKEVFPPRSSKTVPIQLSKAEEKLHRMVDEYISRRLDEARDRREYNAMRFLGGIIRKRASSSLKALKLTLERRIARLGQAIDTEQAIRRMREAEEEFDEELYEENEQNIIGLTISKIEEDRKELNEILAEAEKIQEDSKLKALLDFVATIKKGAPEAKIVIFSEYRDTVDYLFETLSTQYKTGKIYGTMNIEERYEALARFRDPQGSEIMVCTDAAGEGIDMQFANIMINYDLPWNPNRLEQRMGRIHRIGQIRPVYYYNFILLGTIDGYILSKVLEKIEAIKQAIGDKVYDVVGKLLTEEDIASLYEELLKAPKELWEAKVKKVEGIIEERRRILNEINALLSGYRLDRSKLEEIRKVRLEAVDKGEVRRFIETYLGHKGGKIEALRPEDEVYRLILPQKLAYKLGYGTIVGSFSSRVAEQKNYPYLALGNKCVMGMILDAMKPSVAIFEHPTLRGILYVYRVLLKDGKGQERDGRIIALLYSDGKIINIDPRSIWDLEPIYKEQEVDSKTIMEGKIEAEKKLSELIMQIKAENTEKIEEIKNKTRDIIITYYSKRIDDIYRKINEYKQKIRESPHYSKLIAKEENTINILKKELDSKLREMATGFEIHAFFELVGIAQITEKTGADLKRIVELKGVEAVLEYERSRAKSPEEISKIKDVSLEYRGYDVESFDRVIEVKSLSETGPVEMTSHEWETAARMKEVYWLYIVENVLKQPKIYTIQNPSEKFRSIVKKIPKIDYRYMIEDWKVLFRN